MTKTKKKKLEQLAHLKIPLKINVHEDRRGRYINYCNSSGHLGIISDKILREKNCLNKGCPDYGRFYELNMKRKKEKNNSGHSDLLTRFYFEGPQNE